MQAVWPLVEALKLAVMVLDALDDFSGEFVARFVANAFILSGELL